MLWWCFFSLLFIFFLSFTSLFPWWLASLNFLPINSWIPVLMQHKCMTVFKEGPFVTFFATYTTGGRTLENLMGVHRNSILSFMNAQNMPKRARLWNWNLQGSPRYHSNKSQGFLNNIACQWGYDCEAPLCVDGW